MKELSVAILAKNAEQDLAGALSSVEWADDVVVGIDDTTTDRTAEVAESFANVRVGTASLAHGFGVAKNGVIALTKHDWVLVMDTDERVTPELKSAILAASGSNVAAYELNRLNVMLGQEMKHGGWWPDYQLRLFNKKHAQYSSKPVHEELQVHGRVGRLESHFIHFTHPTFSGVLDRIQRYSDYEAELIVADFAKSDRKVGLKAILVPSFRKLWWRMVTKSAWLDGLPGVIEAISWSFYVFCNYAKAWELQQKYKKTKSE